MTFRAPYLSMFAGSYGWCYVFCATLGQECWLGYTFTPFLKMLDGPFLWVCLALCFPPVGGITVLSSGTCKLLLAGMTPLLLVEPMVLAVGLTGAHMSLMAATGLPSAVGLFLTAGLMALLMYGCFELCYCVYVAPMSFPPVGGCMVRTTLLRVQFGAGLMCQMLGVSTEVQLMEMAALRLSLTAALLPPVGGNPLLVTEARSVPALALARTHRLGSRMVMLLNSFSMRCKPGWFPAAYPFGY